MGSKKNDTVTLASGHSSRIGYLQGHSESVWQFRTWVSLKSQGWQRLGLVLTGRGPCSGCHNKLLHRGDRQTTEILSFMLLDPEVQDQGVGRVRRHLKGLGTKSALPPPSFPVASSGVHCSSAGSCTNLASAFVLTSCLCFYFCIQMTPVFGLGPTPIGCDLIFNWLHLQRPHLQIKSYLQALEVCTLGYLSGEYNWTQNTGCLLFHHFPELQRQLSGWLATVDTFQKFWLWER